MLDGSWLMAQGSWPREARGGSWLMAEAGPGPGPAPGGAGPPGHQGFLMVINHG